MAAGEHERLHDDGDRHERAALAVALPDQRRQRQRDRAEEALFHESRLQRDGDRRERRHRAPEDLGIGERFRRLPPAEEMVGRVIERGDERERERHEQVAADGASQHRLRRRGLARPRTPQLRMVGKRAPRKTFRRHEHERIEEAAAQCHRRRRARHAQPEMGGRLRGIGVEPVGRRIRERRSAQKAADDEPRHQRGTPQQIVSPQEPQDTEDAASDAIQNTGGERRRPRDRVVRAPQFAVAQLERFRHMDVVRDFGERIAGDREPQPERRLADVARRVLVDEAVVDAARRTGLLCSIEQTQSAEIHAPVGVRARLGELARGFAIQREARRIGRHEALGQLPRETPRRAVRTKAHDRLDEFAGLEQPHVPPVGSERVARHQRGKRGLAATFQLDVVLRFLIMGEARCRVPAGGHESQAGRDLLRLRNRLRLSQLDVEIDEWDREWKEAPRDEERGRGKNGISRPEGGTPGWRDARHAPAAVGVVAMTPRSASAAIASTVIPRRACKTAAVCSPSSGGARS